MADVDRTSKSEGQSGDGMNATGATQAGAKSSTMPDYYEVGWTESVKGLWKEQVISKGNSMLMELKSKEMMDSRPEWLADI